MQGKDARENDYPLLTPAPIFSHRSLEPTACVGSFELDQSVHKSGGRDLKLPFFLFERGAHRDDG